jgi:3'(2'), 5'-bisphosphate nucleotidase
MGQRRSDLRGLRPGHGDPPSSRRRPRADQARITPPDGLVIVHSRSHENSRRLAEFLQGLSGAGAHECGSAPKFRLIAAGEGDMYPRFGTTMEWDTAAGQAVLEAAGGRVETLERRPLTYGKPGFKNDGFIAWGRPATSDG